MTGISSALKVGSDVYQTDCGLGSLNAFTNAGFRFDDLKSMFITHLHTDRRRLLQLLPLRRLHGLDNLIALAKYTDILDEAYYHNRFPPNYLVNSHTSAEQVGEVSPAANAKHVVLSHYSPTGLADSQWPVVIGKHYQGKVTVARDARVFARRRAGLRSRH
jgi:ribonuclease BN (tRNA processing enzyme)